MRRFFQTQALRAWRPHQGIWLIETYPRQPFFNRDPVVKQRVLTRYKQVNGQMVEKPRVSQQAAQLLLDYYTGDVDELVACFDADVAEARNWLTEHRTGS